MGNWRMTVEGLGSHHNGSKAVMKDGSEVRGGVKSDQLDNVDHWEPTYPNDADILWRKFVEALKAAGHTINAVRFEVLGQVEYK